MIIGYCALLFSLCCALVLFIGLFVPQRERRDKEIDYIKIYRAICPKEL